MKEYVELSSAWDGAVNTAYPLIVAFSRDAINETDVEGYHAAGWDVLQKLHELDPVPWPETVVKDPSERTWSMRFNGMPLFFNMSNPAHVVRRSRNLGPHFIFVINPRERFDVFAGDTQSGRKARENIRSRIADYDGAPHCWQLSSYGVEGLEWWQYGIIEGNTRRTDACPFKYKK